MRALIFLLLGFPCFTSLPVSHAMYGRGFPWSLKRELTVAQQNPGKDNSQMKFSTPSQETPSPFVFIILTTLFKELSSSTSIRLSLQRCFCAPIPPIYLELIPSEVQRCVSVTALCIRIHEEGRAGDREALPHLNK